MYPSSFLQFSAIRNILYSFVLILLSCIVRSGPASVSQITAITAARYVNAALTTGNNDGSSWENAYQGTGGLSEALYEASQDESIQYILVAKGTYIPSRRGDNYEKGAADDKNNTFVLVEGVQVLGGFAGTETHIDERNRGENQTILSGETGDNNIYNNCYHVLVSVDNTPATVLDGFIVTLGYATDNNSLTVKNKTIPSSIGSGMYNHTSSPTIRNVVFTYNSTLYHGAGIVNDNSSPAVTNAVFFRNLSDLSAGAMYNINGSRPLITHTTFHRNYGCAIINDAESGATIYNSILWGNTSWESSIPADILDQSGSGTVVRNSVTQAFGTHGTDGIIKEDPLFLSLNPPSNVNGKWMTPEDGLTLKSNSPAINSGDNSLIPDGITSDITGAERISNGRPDMGAYEFSSPCTDATVLYVDSSATTGGDGTSWSTAFKTVKEALDIANQCAAVEEIRVAKGTYYPTTLANQDLSFVISHPLKIYGGYPSGGGTRDHRTYLSILDGNIGDPEIATDNSSHIMIIAGISSPDSVVIDGLLFQNGRTIDSGASVNINGIAVPRILGGAIYIGNNADTPVVVRNSTFTHNYSSENGGAIYSRESRVIVHSCRFFSNNAMDQAAGIYVFKGTIQIANSLFTGNISGGPGGAITLNEASASSLISSTLYKNHSTGTTAYGGAVNCDKSSLDIYNTLFAANTYGGPSTSPGREKSDIDAHSGSTLTIRNSLMQSGSLYTDCHNCLAPGTDPQFTDVTSAAQNGLGLLPGSAAIDRGDNASLPAYIINDLSGADRIRGEQTDMGAFEAAPLTGLTRLYVNEALATGSNNGSDWKNAFYSSNGFARALEYARNNESVKEIWVAKGTYYTYCRADNQSSANPLDPNNSFVLVNGVAIYGGFAGNEDDRSLRDWKTNITILSGDQNKNNIADAADAFQVLISLGNGPETIIDGFTVTGGHAASSSSNSILVNGTQIGQFSGGGMFNLNSSPTIRNCIFYKNVSRNAGGGMANWDHSLPHFSNVIFRQNRALKGGGMYNGLTNFYGNIMTYTLSGLRFEENVAEGVTGGEGGAVCNNRVYVSFKNTVFTGNSAIRGGAVSLAHTTQDDINFGSYSNCLFIGNTASSQGGVVYFVNDYSNGPLFINSTFSGNSCQDASGGDVIFFLSTGPIRDYPTFYNCIIEKTPGSENFYGGTWPNQFTPKNNLTDYAVFASRGENNTVTNDLGLTDSTTPAGADGEYGTADDGLIPLPASPAINGGNNNFIPSWLTQDIAGYNRIQGTSADMGAYEHNEPCMEVSAPLARDGDVISLMDLSDNPALLLVPDRCRVMGIIEPINPELQLNNRLTAHVKIEETSALTPSYKGQPYVKRRYDLQPETDAEAHEGYLTLYYDNAEFEDFNNTRGAFNPLPVSASDPAVANIRIWQWHGVSAALTPGSYQKDGQPSEGNYIKPKPEDINWNDGQKRWEIKFRFSGFSGFFVTTQDPGSLPVTLASFTVSANNTEPGQTTALLRWSTTTESKSERFEIERSADGKNWNTIGQVKAEGNSTSLQEYSFTDLRPMRGTNLYHLKMIDTDGSFAYSIMRSIDHERASELILYPNPVADRLFIDAGSGKTVHQVEIRNITGQIIGQYPYDNHAGISVKALTPGMYYVKVVDHDGHSEHGKIIIGEL